jgi:hypothetical protein
MGHLTNLALYLILWTIKVTHFLLLPDSPTIPKSESWPEPRLKENLWTSSSWTSNVSYSSRVIKSFFLPQSFRWHTFYISFNGLVSLPPFVLFLNVLSYEFLLLYPQVRHAYILFLSSSFSIHGSLSYCKAGSQYYALLILPLSSCWSQNIF